MAQQILTSDQVLARVGFSKATRDRMEAAGQFPKRIPISTRRRGWLAEEVDAFVEARRVASRE